MSPASRPVAARFFPDVAHVFVAGMRADGRQDGMTLSLDDGTRKSIPHPPGLDLRFAAGGRVEVSPDGRELAYYSQPGGDVIGTECGLASPG